MEASVCSQRGRKRYGFRNALDDESFSDFSSFSDSWTSPSKVVPEEG